MIKHKTLAYLLLGTSLALGIIGCGGGGTPKEDRDYYTSGSLEADQRAEQLMARDAQLKGGEPDDVSVQNKITGEEKTGPEGVPLADEKKTLYDRLGGETGMASIVDDVVARWVADPQVNLERKGVQRGGLSFKRGESMAWQANGQTLEQFKQGVREFLSLKSGGPTQFAFGDLKSLTDDLHFTNAEFDAAIGDLKATLDKLQIPNQEQKELLALAESTRTQIVEDR
jgi:hemoglobin